MKTRKQESSIVVGRVTPCAPALASGKTARSGLTRPACITLLLALLAMTISLPAQTCSIDWATIDGGGGTSTGSVYSVSGTIGQPDAAGMSGGNYTLQGGFWGVLTAVQTPGAPWLTIARTATNTVVVSWPAPAVGWSLERTNALPAVTVASWPAVLLPYQTNGGVISVTFTNLSATGSQFFRLHKP